MFATLADDAPRLPTGPEGQRHLDALVAEGTAIASQISQLQARQVELAAEADAVVQLGDMTTAAWLAWQWGLTPKEAGRIMWLAKRLRRLPRLSNAFAEGRLSEGVVASMTSVATADNEDAIIEVSRIATGAQLQTLLRDFRRLRPNPDLDPPAPGDDSNDDSPGDREESLSWDYEDTTAMLRGRFRLSPENGALFEAAMRAAREIDAEHEPDLDAQRAHPHENTPTSNPDAFMRLIDSFLVGTTTTHGLIPDRFHALIVLNTQPIEPEPAAKATGAYLHDAGGIALDAISPLLCEASISYLVKHRGQAVTVTSPTRFATREQLLALLERDRCCTYPGCGRRHYLIAHHVHHHADGGVTHLHNLIMLCKKHHRVVHRPGWRIELDHDAHTKRFYRPDDTQVTRSNPRPPAGHLDLPDPGPRHTGTHDRLTDFARDVILHDWLDEADRPTTPTGEPGHHRWITHQLHQTTSGWN